MDVIISDLLSIGGIINLHDLIRGESRNYLSKPGHFWDDFSHTKTIQRRDG